MLGQDMALLQQTEHTQRTKPMAIHCVLGCASAPRVQKSVQMRFWLHQHLGTLSCYGNASIYTSVGKGSDTPASHHGTMPPQDDELYLNNSSQPLPMM